MPSLRFLGALIAALWAAPVLAIGWLVKPAWREGLAERLGAHPARSEAPGAVWVHAASVGEVQAALPLIDALRERGARVIASTMTLTGREQLRGARADVACGLAPLDHPWCVARALRSVEPRALLFVETELWPSWIAACERRGIPVGLASARLSDRSFPRYKRFSALIAGSLRRIDRIAARSDRDAERFVWLGVPASRVRVTGDLKLAARLDAPPLAADLAAALGDVPLFVAGSTHDGEERAALDALDAVEAAGQPVAVALAPRHPQRADTVAGLARSRGRTVVRRSLLAGERIAPGDVLLLDTVGELASLYAHAAVAFVGGTLAPVGGHNLLEPIAHGVPVLFGPHVENAHAAAALLEETAAGASVSDAGELAERLVEWLAKPEPVREAAARARDAVAAQHDSGARTLDWLAPLLEPGPAPASA